MEVSMVGRKPKADEMDSLLGRNIKRYRNQLGFSQKEVAQEIGVSFQQLQKYEKGENRIAASRLYKLAKMINLEMEDFFISPLALTEKTPNKKKYSA